MNIPPGLGGFTICFLLYGAGATGFFIKKYAPGEIRERLVFRLCFYFSALSKQPSVEPVQL